MAGGGAVNRIGGHIAHCIGGGEDAGQHAQNIGGLVGAGIVGPHQRVRGVQRAVEEFDLGVLGGHLETGSVHPHAGGKDHVGAVVGHLFQNLLCVHFGVHVLMGGEDHPVGEGVGERAAALFVGPHPGAVLLVVLVEEGHMELAGPRTEDVQLGQAQQGLAGLGGLQHHFHRLVLGQDGDFVPDAGQIFLIWAGVESQASEYR